MDGCLWIFRRRRRRYRNWWYRWRLGRRYQTWGKGVVGVVSVSNTSADNNAYAVLGQVTGGPPKNSQQIAPYAGRFDGPVQINGLLQIDVATNTQGLNVNGNFTVVNGAKHVAVPFPDGSHRVLYCMESPENWFEDFGEAKLVKGKTQVKLPRDFAGTIKTDSYQDRKSVV